MGREAIVTTCISGALGVTIISIIAFTFFRKEDELKARLPTIIQFLVWVDVIFMVVLLCDETEVFSCTLKLWSGNILYALHVQLLGIRNWAMTILYNRNLRIKFFWATKPCFVLILAAFGMAYTIFYTVFAQVFYLHTHDPPRDKCYFLLPWWNYVCVFSSILPLVFLWYFKIETKSIQRIHDDFGIHREVNFLKYSGLFVQIYVMYSQLCENGMVQEKLPAILLLLVNIFGVLLLGVTLPAIRVIARKMLQPQLKRVIPVAGCCTNSEINTVPQILASENYSKQFREHALRHWCAESVDFCLEVSKYKHACEPEYMTPIVVCYGCFLAIVEEFVKDGAPCEVNLSGQQKAAILQVKNLQAYQDLGHANSAIFDDAQKEMYVLLQVNLLPSFVMK